MSIKKLGVLGAGIMGSGIAQVGAQAGLEVIRQSKNWEKSIAKGHDCFYIKKKANFK